MSCKLLSIGSYGLHIIQYPSKKYGYVGSVPEILCIERKNSLGLNYMASRVFDTEEEAMQYFQENKHLLA